jgi:hypothetical protein
MGLVPVDRYGPPTSGMVPVDGFGGPNRRQIRRMTPTPLLDGKTHRLAPTSLLEGQTWLPELPVAGANPNIGATPIVGGTAPVVGGATNPSWGMGGKNPTGNVGINPFEFPFYNPYNFAG